MKEKVRLWRIEPEGTEKVIGVKSGGCGQAHRQQAAEILDLSLRQVRKILAAYRIVSSHGIPQALYRDRHSVFE